MITDFIFTVGLPGCGKSTFLKKHYTNVFEPIESYNNGSYGKFLQDKIREEKRKNKEVEPVVIISADELKTIFPEYNDEHPECVHEKSVRLAKEYVEYLSKADDFNDIVVMDGGGINNHYNENIINFIREYCPKCKITAVYFDVPINVCIERVRKRVRKVPEDEIYKKNLKLRSCLYRYIDIVDDFIRVDYFTNKYIFLDMDGVICSYANPKSDKDGNCDFVNGKLFRYLKPVKHIINFVKEHYNMENVFICTACPNSIAWQEKNEWLDEFFPEIPNENRLFCGNKYYKHVFIEHFALKNKMELNDIVLVDDFHDTIKKSIEIGINAIHPSNIESLNDKFAFFS